MQKPSLYLLTDESPLPILLARLNEALATGCIALLQIRRKNTPITARYQEYAQIITVAERYGVPVVINDEVDLAKAFGVGVHLGQGDGSVVQARQTLGQAIIGRTCHDKVDWVIQSMKDGADYAAIGAVFASSTKPNAKPMQLSDEDKLKLINLVDNGLKLCVIGGMTLDNVPSLKQSLPIVPTYIAVTADIMAQPFDSIARHCQKWHARLQDF